LGSDWPFWDLDNFASLQQRPNNDTSQLMIILTIQRTDASFIFLDYTYKYMKIDILRRNSYR